MNANQARIISSTPFYIKKCIREIKESAESRSCSIKIQFLNEIDAKKSVIFLEENGYIVSTKCKQSVDHYTEYALSVSW
jgi:hypothetical protein